MNTIMHRVPVCIISALLFLVSSQSAWSDDWVSEGIEFLDIDEKMPYDPASRFLRPGARETLEQPREPRRAPVAGDADRDVHR